MATSTFTTFSLHSWGFVDADFCISSAYVTSRTRWSFSSLNSPAPWGLKLKKHEKKHEISAFKSLLKDLIEKSGQQKAFLKLQHLSFKMKKKLPAAEAYRNGAKLNYVHPRMVLAKVFKRSIHVITTWNSREKNKVGNTTWAKSRPLIGQNRPNRFQ